MIDTVDCRHCRLHMETSMSTWEGGWCSICGPIFGSHEKGGKWCFWFRSNPTNHLWDMFLVTKHVVYKSPSHANSNGCQINTEPSIPAFGDGSQRPFRPVTWLLINFMWTYELSEYQLWSQQFASGTHSLTFLAALDFIIQRKFFLKNWIQWIDAAPLNNWCGVDGISRVFR